MTFANHTVSEKRALRRTCRHCGARRGEWCVRARRPRTALIPTYPKGVLALPKAIRSYERAEYLHRCRGDL